MAVRTAIEALREATLSSAELERLLVAVNRSDRIEIIGWRKISLAAMSKLLAYVLSRKYETPASTPLQLTIGSEALRNEFFRMKFFEVAARDPSVEPILNVDELAAQERIAMANTISRRCMPYEIVAKRGQFADEFYSNCGAFLMKLQDLFEATLPLFGYKSVARQAFYRPSKEVIENIHLHSGSWGFGGARISNTGLEISYGDFGCGIRSSLLVNPDYTRIRQSQEITELMAIEDAFEWGVSGRPGEYRGTGLYEVRQFALSRGGAVECRSGSARVVFTPTQVVRSQQLVHIDGVQITIFLPQEGHS